MKENFRKVFIDTAPFIYITENSPNFANSSERIIKKFAQNSSFVTSTITITEFSIKPMVFKEEYIISKFINF